MIATNTTLSREGVENLPHGEESGRPERRTRARQIHRVIRQLAAELQACAEQGRGSALPIIGVGGILSGADAAEKIHAGAALVQIYSGLIYRGPALVAESCAAIRAI